MTAHDVSDLNHDALQSDNLCAVIDRAYRGTASFQKFCLHDPNSSSPAGRQRISPLTLTSSLTPLPEPMKNMRSIPHYRIILEELYESFCLDGCDCCGVFQVDSGCTSAIHTGRCDANDYGANQEHNAA